jgi:hypothetical protein
VLSEPDSVDRLDPAVGRPADTTDFPPSTSANGPADGTADGARPTRRRSGRRLAAAVLLALGCVFTGLCLVIVFSSWWDDHSIDSHLGRSDADVLSVSFNRAAVRFVTPDGTVYIPPNGILYPSGLAAGERVRVEYDTQSPDVVRVAGRDYRLAFLPVGSTLLIAWAVLVPLIWWLRRRPGAPLPRWHRSAARRG